MITAKKSVIKSSLPQKRIRKRSESQSDFKVRRATDADIQRIHDLIMSAEGRLLKRSRADIRKSIRFFFVVEVQSTIVASCALEIYNKKLAEVRSVVVDPDWQKQGVASAMITRCVDEAKRRRIYEVLAITDSEGVFRRQ
ncbi:MAG: GNAT family N-acetyltransferase, partial [Dehalococcoidia bacterium]|nr:GNAT family N-acetyltransferase [Dehalococcoidia bacterium]